MIDALLNPALYRISSEISVVALTAAVKVFAYFTAEAAEDWTRESFNDAKALVVKMTETLAGCTSSAEVELQERVSRDEVPPRHVLADAGSLGDQLSAAVPIARGRSVGEQAAGGATYPRDVYRRTGL